MGCVQGKPSLTNSPPGNLQRLKMENGYAANRVGVVGPRRSTGQRYDEREYVGRFREKPSDGSEGNSELIGREEEESTVNGGNGSRRISMEENEGEEAEELGQGWPKWLLENVPKRVLAGLVPKSAESYDKIDKIGQGTYSNVYKARDRDTGKIVALKKVRFETSEPESIKFMAREISILRQLDHPNVVKLEGLATSRMQYSLYLVFEFMQSDLARLICRPERLTEPQIKFYMHQLLSGLQHCHDRGILHRDIKGSNLLIDRNGMLKIADFGLANYYRPDHKHHLTNRVVTLWYRAPELLLGATNYGVGIDLWSAGCLLAEMFSGRPIMPGRSEFEQLNKIFKLCGTPSEDYWKKLKLSRAFSSPQIYKPSLVEAFSDFPICSLGLLKILLSLDPAYRGSASSALQNEFFSTEPLACDLSGLRVIHNDEDELDQAKEEKRKRKAKTRRSRTHRELRRVDSSPEKTEDLFSSKEEKVVKETAEAKPESSIQAEEQSSTTSSGTFSTFPSINLAKHKGTSSTTSGSTFSTFSSVKLGGLKEVSSATTSTTSSSSNLTRQKESPFFLISPVRPSKQKTTVGNHRYSDASVKDKKLPPLPAKPKISIIDYSRENKVHKENQIHRSTSTREIRGLHQREH